MTAASATHDLLVTLADLTRACCANENYFAWLTLNDKAFNGSVGIASYLASAALAFEEQSHPTGDTVDVLSARDSLADILMVSAPLSPDEMRAAVAQCIRECRDQEVSA